MLITKYFYHLTWICFPKGVDTATIGKGQKITVVGKVDPLKLREKVEQKTHKKVELISPVPNKEANKENNGGDNQKQEKKKESKDKNSKDKPDEKKSKEEEVLFFNFFTRILFFLFSLHLIKLLPFMRCSLLFASAFYAREFSYSDVLSAHPRRTLPSSLFNQELNWVLKLIWIIEVKSLEISWYV